MEEETSAAVMNYLRCSNINVFDFIRNAHEFEKKRDIIISKTLIGDDRFKNSEDETTVVAKVLKLKDVLDSSEQSEAVLLAALSKLQSTVMSVKVLKLTGVGVSVNRLRNHASKQVFQVSRQLVKEWKGVVDDWLKDNNEKNKAQSIDQNPPQTEKPRSLVVRIKLKKDDSKEVSKPVLDVSHETVKKVLDESVKAPGIGKSVRVLDEIHGSGLKTGRKIIQVHSGNLNKRLIDDAGDAIEEKFRRAFTNLKKSYLEDENVKKKRRIQLLSRDEQISLAVSRQEFKPPLKRQIRRRW